MAFYRDQIWKLDEYHEIKCFMMLMWEFVRHINKKSYVLIIVGSEPCPYMARISHDPPRSNYVAILKIEDKSHACGRSSIKIRPAYQQLLLHSHILKMDIRYPFSLYPLLQDCLAYGFASSCKKQRKSAHLES